MPSHRPRRARFSCSSALAFGTFASTQRIADTIALLKQAVKCLSVLPSNAASLSHMHWVPSVDAMGVRNIPELAHVSWRPVLYRLVGRKIDAF